MQFYCVFCSFFFFFDYFFENFFLLIKQDLKTFEKFFHFRSFRNGNEICSHSYIHIFTYILVKVRLYAFKTKTKFMNL